MVTRLAILLLLVIPFCPAAPPKTSCPPVSSTCSCEPGVSGMLSVSCEGASLPSLFKDLGALPLERLRITKCEQPILDILPRGPIRCLEISDCKIERIDHRIFSTTSESLEEIILANNSLSEVPDLGTLPKLTSLDLNGNKIKDVAENALLGVKNIQQLRMERNNICNLSSKAFEEVKDTLRLLDLSGNCLSRIPAHNLRNNNKLMYLDLADNQIAEINNFELMNLPELQEIRLDNNELRIVHPMAFMNVPQLKHLSIRDNLLSTLDGSRLVALSQLEVLDATNNLLSKVPTLKDFPRLTQVLLDGNLIEKLDTLTFSNNSQLTLISLQNNNIGQIARNSFDALDQMQVLLMGNNSLTSLERGMFDGMRRLIFLHLRNNSISKIDPNAFASVPNLHSLDLAYNRLSTIPPKTFSNLAKLQWLELSNNQLKGFGKGTFNQKIETMLLDGNQWICDENFDWFVAFLVTNRVRTFLPQQKEIDCAGPSQFQGVRLRDLMMKKANDTIAEGMKTLDRNGQKSIIPSFIPGFGGWNPAQSLGNLAAGVPILPTTPAIPGMNALSGGQPAASDVQQFIQSSPNFIVSIPGFGDIDLSKVDPSLIDYVLKGGQLPGIPKEVMDGVLQNYMKRIGSAAQSAKLQKGQDKFLVPMDRLPKEAGNNGEEVRSLPGLTQDGTNTMMEHHTKGVPVIASNIPRSGGNFASGVGGQMAELWKLLPPNYNISKIPQEVITAIMKGEFPDMNKLPNDLLEHFKQNSDKMTALFTKMTPANNSLEDILSKIPSFAKPVLSTFSPYDINKLSTDMIHEEEIRAKAAKMRIYTAIALGLVGAITLIVLGFFVIYLKKQRTHKRRGNQTTIITH